MGRTKSRANGDGTFFYNETKKLWVGQITLGVQDNGKLKELLSTVKREKKLKKKLRIISQSLVVGKYQTRTALH